MSKRKNLKITKNWLEDEYINKEKSTYQIAKEINYSASVINYFLKKFNIPARSDGHPPKKLDKEYILSNIKISLNGCWEWQRKINKITGYGQLSFKKQHFLAHRISYKIFKEEIPIGLVINHLCKNRKCVNPEHLEIVTLRENILKGNGFAAVNTQKEVCLRGHLLSGINLYITPDGRRQCKICMKIRGKIYLEKKIEVCYP